MIPYYDMLFKEPPIDFSPKFEVVACIVDDGEHFLLLKRHPDKPEGGTWCLPAGKIEPGETPVQAMFRELEEETGYHAQGVDAQHVTSSFVRYPTYDFIFHLFAIKIPARFEVCFEPQAHTEFRWVTYKEALELDLIQEGAPTISLYYANPRSQSSQA